MHIQRRGQFTFGGVGGRGAEEDEAGGESRRGMGARRWSRLSDKKGEAAREGDSAHFFFETRFLARADAALSADHAGANLSKVGESREPCKLSPLIYPSKSASCSAKQRKLADTYVTLVESVASDGRAGSSRLVSGLKTLKMSRTFI